MLNRRDLLTLGAMSLIPASCAAPPDTRNGLIVNDVHAQLNSTRVARILRPDNMEALVGTVRLASEEGRVVSVCGSRHAMGGQQFASDSWLIDMRGMNRIQAIDQAAGTVDVEAGIEWPELIDGLAARQAGATQAWGIVQKQTGADRLTIGGALAANVHGRGLTLRPIIQDVESFLLIDGGGTPRLCSRNENSELFRLAIGGYGLFGVIASVKLRLGRRSKVQRVVQIADIDGIASAFEQRIADGYTYGDFQYSTDSGSDGYLRRGVFSCYRPVPVETPMPADQRALAPADWEELIYLSHADKRRAFDVYAGYYLSTSGQVYWSDTHQLSTYMVDYHRVLDARLSATRPATEMITEIYVPRASLAGFMADIRRDFQANGVNVIYGTVRLIERDDESVLAWAREPWACVIFNLHVVHDAGGLARAEADFSRLIDHAIARGGSYYLTYHRWASRAQVEVCYPRFDEFLRLKRVHDPRERFQSEWYRHYRRMFS